MELFEICFLCVVLERIVKKIYMYCHKFVILFLKILEACRAYSD